MNKSKPYDYLVKLLILGDSGVGKSSILLRYTDDEFTENYITTIGIDFKVKTVNIDGKIVKIQIWDTAGQERFRTITQAYYRGAQGVLLVYDVTGSESFGHMTHWVEDIDKHKDKSVTNVSKILIANKCDLRDENISSHVTSKMGQDLASKYDLPFFEVSAKNPLMGTPINDVFLTLTKGIVKRLSENVIPQPIPPPRPPKSPKCCRG